MLPLQNQELLMLLFIDLRGSLSQCLISNLDRKHASNI